MRKNRMFAVLQTSDMPYPVTKIRERTFETRSLMLMRKVLSGLTS